MTGVSWLELELHFPEERGAELALILEEARLGGWVVEAEERWVFFLPQEGDWQSRLGRLTVELREAGGTVSQRGEVQDEDWAENWKRFYHPLKVGRRLVVCPSWEEYAASADDLVLILDPGSAFGTGYHATTRLCLELLEELPPCRLLDLGTGSGILAIAASKLGYSDLTAIDNDPVAVRVANENFAINRLELQACLGETASGGPYDLITANLVARVHLDLAVELAASLRPGGKLIAGGIIRDQREPVLEAFAAAGLAPVDERGTEEWVVLLLERRH